MGAYIVKDLLHYCNVKLKEVSLIQHETINYYDFTFVLKGEMTYIVNGIEYTLKENDAILIPPCAVRHRVESFEPIRYVSYNFTVHDGAKMPNKIYLKDIISHNIRNIVTAFSSTHISDLYATREKVMNLLNYILLEINDILGFESNNRHIIEIIKYISEHISEPITLSSVSESVNLSKEYVAHIFKKETGKTVTDYINERRLFIAKEMILSTNYSLTYIASRVGYDNYSYFSKIFKAQFGITPRFLKKA